MQNIQVKKRDSNLEALDIQKIHKVLEWATEGINNVSISEIELQSGLQFTNGIETEDIQKILIKSAADLISERYPNYQYVAARLLLMELRKEVYKQFEPKPLLDTVISNINEGYYENIFEYYTANQIEYFDSKINYQRDFDFTYSGLRTMIDKFTVTNKKICKVFETPQQIFMLVSMMLFRDSSSDRKKNVIDFYNSLSSFKISLPSPIMAGLRTPTKGYSSCCLIDLGDTKESLTAANSASVIMTTIKSGIGLYGGSIRGIGAGVSNNTVKHTGNVPILKWFESAVKSFSQGARGGSATIYYPFYHFEIEKILTLKSNKSTEENSVRKLDYGIGLNQLVWDRARLNEDLTLFSSEEARNLDLFLDDYDKWLNEYIRLENTKNIRNKKISARKFLKSFATEAFETGRYYPLFLDNANKGPLKSIIKMSNLCAEILLPVSPLKSLDDPNAEIALCILSNINAARVSIPEMPRLAELIVMGLNNIIDIQSYPLPAAENSTKNARYLGIGVSDWAHKLSREKVRYNTQEALDISEEYMENWQFNLLQASLKLAKETECAPWFREKSKYNDGWLPNDGKWRFIPPEKWEELRADIKLFGLKNLVLSAAPPSGTSSDLSNSTSGLDMPRDFIVTKNSIYGPMKQIIPNFSKGSSYYTTAFNVDNIDYINMLSKFQLYLDQSISANTYWSEKDFIDGKMPLGKLIKTFKYAQQKGLKTLYYTTFDDSSIAINSSNTEGCDGGGCSV